MKLVRTLSMFLALAGASTVYADTPTKAPPADKKAPAKTEMSADEIKKTEEFFQAFYDAIVKNQDACPKMGPAINVVLDKHLPWLQKMQEAGKEPPQATKDKMQAKQGDMMNAMLKCKDDKGVEAAMKRFMAVATKKKDSTKTEAAPPPAPPAKK
jgi:hypothetical protein